MYASVHVAINVSIMHIIHHTTSFLSVACMSFACAIWVVHPPAIFHLQVGSNPACLVTSRSIVRHSITATNLLHVQHVYTFLEHYMLLERSTVTTLTIWAVPHLRCLYSVTALHPALSTLTLVHSMILYIWPEWTHSKYHWSKSAPITPNVMALWYYLLPPTHAWHSPLSQDQNPYICPPSLFSWPGYLLPSSFYSDIRIRYHPNTSYS